MQQKQAMQEQNDRS